MKSSLTFLFGVCAAVVFAAPRSSTPTRHVVEEIEFRHAPAASDATMIWLARTTDGKVTCTVYSIPAGEARGPAGKEWRKLKTSEVTPAEFEEFAAALESREFRDAAEEASPPNSDGPSWVFRRKAGSRVVEYWFLPPEERPEAKSSALAMKLGRQIAAAAGVGEIFSGTQKSGR